MILIAHKKYFINWSIIEILKQASLTFAVMFILIVSPSVVPAAPAVKYNLDVSINVAASEVSGIARIEVVSGNPVLMIRKGPLEVAYVTLNKKKIDLKEDFRTLRIFPDKDGLLEISYKVSFKEEDSTREKESGAAQNVIDTRGISLTNIWYPEIYGQKLFNLKVTLPKGYEAVSEGEEVKKTSRSDSTEFFFNFPHPLDGINLTASDKFEVKKDFYNDIEIYTYFFSEDAGLAGTYIEFTKKYLKLYEGMLGKYPYKRFSVVENFLPTGYSFPTFTLLGNTIVPLPFIVETSLGHEILHQWFGNNVYVDAKKGNWSEGLTAYLSDHLYEEIKGKGWEYRKHILTDYKNYIEPDSEFALINFKGRTDFATQAVGYGKAAMVFHMLKNILGEKTFFDALKDFHREYSFRPASWEDLNKSFEKFSQRDLSGFFRQWLYEPGLPRIIMEEMKLRPQGKEFELSFNVKQAKNTHIFNLPLTIYLKNEILKKSFLVDKENIRFELLLPDRPYKVVVDEDYDVARELDPEEVSPVISGLLGKKDVLVVLPQTDKEIYQAVIARFEKDGAVTKSVEEINENDLRSSSLAIFGVDNPVLKKLVGGLPAEDAGFSLVVKKHPLNLNRLIGIINGRSKEEVDAAFGKVSHYGKYSRLLFNNGKNIVKEVEQTQRGIIVYTQEDAPAVDLSTAKTLSDVISSVADKKIVYVGEMHDVFAHHAVQLDIIRGIYKKNGKVAIGMEMFQRPFQETLDRFVSGEIDEADFLKRSEYFKRWGFDYNLYKPILDFARTEQIPVVALNMKREIIDKVSREGIASLPDEEKKEVPEEMDFSDSNYKERLKKIFEQHKNAKDKNFEFFYQSQLLWDETMSNSIDEFLGRNSGLQIVVLAGRGHLEYGSGIPKRTLRRNGHNYAVVLIDSEIEKGIADYVIFPKPVEGVTSPKLMVFISEEDKGIKITGFPEHSVSEKAGIKSGDIMLSLDGKEMKTIDDIKIYLLYKKTGETIKVEVLREDKKMLLDVTL